MTAPLSTRRSLDPDTMWRSMPRLIDRVHAVLGRESLVDDCLDILVELLGADRGLMVRIASDGSSRVIHARAR